MWLYQVCVRSRVKYLEMLDHDYDISLMLCLRIKILQNVLTLTFLRFSVVFCWWLSYFYNIYWVNILTLNIQFNRAWSCEETAVESTLIKRVILNLYILQSQAAFSEWNASGIIMYNFATSQFRFCGQTSPVFAVHGLFSRPCYQMEYIGFLLLFWSENIFAR